MSRCLHIFEIVGCKNVGPEDSISFSERSNGLSESPYIMSKRLAEVIAYSESLLEELADRDAPEAVRMKLFLKKDIQEKRRLLLSLRDQAAKWQGVCERIA